MESKIKQANEEVKNLAEINLNYEGKLLLALADYLSDHRMLQKKEIREFVNQFASNSMSLFETSNQQFYRTELKQQVKEHEATPPVSRHFDNVFSLNSGE
ncbi:MAG: hypothetical protein ACQES1_04290 [Bacteroidota bacterium]